jgi:hypothetical protein
MGSRQDTGASASQTGLSPSVEPASRLDGSATSNPSAWRRYRFRSWAADDPRPVTFPPPGPYWITGSGEERDGREFATLVAYLPGASADELEHFWPETDGILWDGYDFQWRDEIAFTSRFTKPDWWSQ